MNKRLIPLMILPLFLFGCGKNKDVYASSKNTIYEFKLDGDNAIITGLNSNYRNQADIIIPYSIDKHVVKRIENYSFEEVYRLKNIDMSKSNVEEIGSSVFKKCDKLSNIKFPKTIKYIGENAFEECDGLSSLDLSNCVLEEISNNMFLNCSSLSNVTFPKTVKRIGSNIYSGCDTITEIDLTDLEIEELGDYAFYNLKNLKDVKLSQTTKKIGAYAFSDDKKIQFLNFTNTQIETIGEGAFSKCSLLANINLPTTLKELGDKTFYYCSKLEKIDLSKTSVEVISESCFELCRVFDRITLPVGLKTLSTRSFYNSSLRLINITKNVDSIADDAFRLCNKLEEITVDNNNTSFVIQSSALYTIDKEKLIAYPVASAETSFTISADAKTINAYAFANAVNLVSVDLRSINISEIQGYTFMNCTALKEVKLIDSTTQGVKKIGVRAFFNCKSLTEFDGKYALEEIGDSAFYDCTSLISVLLGNSSQLTKISTEAFYNCNKMKTLSLTGSLQVVGRSAFYNCNDVENFSFVGGTKNQFNILISNNPDSCLDQFKDLL